MDLYTVYATRTVEIAVEILAKDEEDASAKVSRMFSQIALDASPSQVLAGRRIEVNEVDSGKWEVTGVEETG